MERINSMGLFNFNFGSGKGIGIDLGTANTLVYSKKQKKIVLNEPSVVAVEKETRKVHLKLFFSVFYCKQVYWQFQGLFLYLFPNQN